MANRQDPYGNRQAPSGYASPQQGPYDRAGNQGAYPRQRQQQQHGRQQQGAYQQQRPYPNAAYGRPANGQGRAGYVPTSPNASQYSHYNGRYGGGKRKHTARNVAITILVVLVVVGGFAGFTGYTLYNSAMKVRADASAVMADIDGLKDQVLSENPEQANATTRDISKRAANMEDETSGWAWTVASHVPVYGGDVDKVRQLAGIMDDLSKDALVPLVSEISQVSVQGFMVDGAINVDLANRLVSALNSAAPVITRSYDKLETMGDAKLEQINGPLEKARSALGKLNTVSDFVSSIAPSFADMMGANGQRRTYLIVAQNNSEIRSTGGFLGSIGPLYLDNGRIEMGDFRTIYDINPENATSIFAPITDEEAGIFGIHVSFQINDSNFIPDFSRVGEIAKFAWEAKGYGSVDGVIGVDPVFLQDMLAISGGVTTSNGTVVDGSNAARLLLHDAYYMEDEAQDPFFQEVAAQAFGHVMGHLGSLPLMELADVLNREMDSRRLQVWMAAENEEAAIEVLGCDGKLSHDAAEPVLGVYFDDESYSKLFWYQKADVSVGEGVKNADGSTTYPVTATYWNMIQDIGELSDYMAAHNGIARSPGEMISWVMLSAPQGGYITDVACAAGEFVPAGTDYREFGSDVTGTMTQATLQGLDFWYGLSRTLPGESFSLSFNVTTSRDATEPLKVVRTPNAQEVAGW